MYGIAPNMMAQAMKLYDEHNYPEAAQLFRDVISRDPENEYYKQATELKAKITF
ncbi:MAG: hypothetical protein ISS17_00675 [Bacteroidales bacterium]|nr:hypothetical protein [Bacteroidales bacterium]